jgi:prepilin-type N-terminal cleavage/methylation domain-containing protein
VDTATRDGFTVIELLITLTFVGLLTGIALPSWKSLLSSHYLSSSARIVHSELQSLRMRAAAENSSFRLAYSAGGTSIEIERDGKSLARKPLPNGISITHAGSITFSARGTASPNRVRLSGRDGSCRQVVVSATGRVRSCKVACSADC